MDLSLFCRMRAGSGRLAPSGARGQAVAMDRRPCMAEDPRSPFESGAPSATAAVQSSVVATAAKLECSTTIRVSCSCWARTLPASLAGTPAISVPSGLSEGLPVGLQIMAPALADERCYRVGAAFESAVEPVLNSIPELVK